MTAKHFNFKDSSGFSLVEVMLVAAGMLVAVYIVAGSMVNESTAHRLTATGEAYRDLEEGLKKALVVNLRQQMTVPGGTCKGGAFSLAQSLDNSGLTVSLSRQVGAWTGAPAPTMAAVDRCKSAPFRSLPANKDFYHCAVLGGNSSSKFANTSLAGAKGAFIEVRARLFNVATGVNLSCSDYQAILGASGTPNPQGQAAFEMTYALYWYTSGNPNIFKQRSGVFYASPI